MLKPGVWLALLPVFLGFGCTHIQKVTATEGSAFEAPYTSLGTIVVRENVKDLWDHEAGNALKETATLSLAKTPDRADLYKQALVRRLIKTAKDKYGAHAVINLEFWPDPSAQSFPEGLLHARGEMIRYQEFPKTQAVVNA